MKQKLLFLALMAVSSQTLLSHYRHHGYWSGGPSFGLYVGTPGYGYYGPGYYPGYYSPFNVVADVAGAAITANAIKDANDYSRKRMREEDVNKGRRAELAGEIYDAEKELSFLKKSNASASEIAAKKEEIASLNRQLHKLR